MKQQDYETKQNVTARRGASDVAQQAVRLAAEKVRAARQALNAAVDELEQALSKD